MRILTNKGWKELSEEGHRKLVSDDEDAQRAAFVAKAKKEMTDLITKHREQANKIGGNFRGPGIAHELHKHHSAAVNKVK